jgi:tetratricopeptide (TPR) repeat protein
MHDPRKQERRQRLLKEKRAARQREWDLEDANDSYREALQAHRLGNAPGAARAAKKALQLNPDLYAALGLLAEIHFQAEQYADAAYYLGLRRKYPESGAASYNLGVAHFKIGRTQEALKDFQDFLEETRSSRKSEWIRLRESAKVWCQDLA